MEVLDDVILALRRLHQPVIAAVNGAAIGGGLCLALAADIRVASTSAYFRAAGINNGLTASELGLSYLLPRAIGASRAFEIMLTGRDVGAEEAERIGLVSCQVPDEQLLDTCYALAARIAAFSRPGIDWNSDRAEYWPASSAESGKALKSFLSRTVPLSRRHSPGCETWLKSKTEIRGNPQTEQLSQIA